MGSQVGSKSVTRDWSSGSQHEGPRGHSPLSLAARKGHEAIVKLLLETGRMNIDMKDFNGWTPLAWAAYMGHEAVMKLLLETGRVDVESSDSGRRTPLSWAASQGKARRQ